MDFIRAHFGELAALFTAFCWVFTSLSFAAAGRRIGPTAVNFIRLFLACGILLTINRLSQDAWWPTADRMSIVYLALSGLIGLSIGDQLLFVAFIDIGPRLSTLLMTMAPPTAAILAWPVLDEPLELISIVGITITLIGIAWVVLERPKGVAQRRHVHWKRGLICATGGAIAQGGGIVLAKLGIGHTRLDAGLHMLPLTATMVRMAFACVGIVVMTAAARTWLTRRELDAAIDVSPETEHLPGATANVMPAVMLNRRRLWLTALGFTMIGAIFGPVLGVWSSLIAVDLAPAGIAATLMSMTPVFILPFAVWFEKEHITWRAILGAMVAVAGVVVLVFA